MNPCFVFIILICFSLTACYNLNDGEFRTVNGRKVNPFSGGRYNILRPDGKRNFEEQNIKIKRDTKHTIDSLASNHNFEKDKVHVKSFDNDDYYEFYYDDYMPLAYFRFGKNGKPVQVKTNKIKRDTSSVESDEQDKIKETSFGNDKFLEKKNPPYNIDILTIARQRRNSEFIQTNNAKTDTSSVENIEKEGINENSQGNTKFLEKRSPPFNIDTLPYARNNGKPELGYGFF